MHLCARQGIKQRFKLKMHAQAPVTGIVPHRGEPTFQGHIRRLFFF